MADILLINPPDENEIMGNDAKVTMKHGGRYPPLGISYLASSLSPKHRVTLRDYQKKHPAYELLALDLISRSWDYVGISTLTFCLLDVKETIKIIKIFSPKTKIVCGGPHASLYPKETLALGADRVVVGEGEVSNAFEKGAESVVYGRLKDIDSIKFPKLSGLDLEDYRSLFSDKYCISMVTTRGCPYHCNFCYRPVTGKNYRERSSKNVVDEIESSLEMFKGKACEISMYDDTFTINRNRVFQICDEIEKRGLKFDWDIRARVNTVDPEMLKRLKSVGCVRIRMGVESGVQRVLDALNKKITLEQVRNAFKWAKDAGLETFGYFMIGNPAETREDIEKTYKLACELGSGFSQFTILTPFPMTKIYLDWIGLHGVDVWRQFAQNPTKDFKPPVWDEYFTREELDLMLKKIYRSFYTRPSAILNKIRRLRNFRQLREYGKAALEILCLK